MRILLISNMGPLFQAEWIYKYLIKQGHSVVTVGKIYNKELEHYKHNQARMGNNHFPLFWTGDMDENGLPMFIVAISTIFEMLGDEWDAIIECECYNLRVIDPETYFDDGFLKDLYPEIPYFFYKTELLEDHMSVCATHYFYAGVPIFEKMKKLSSNVTNENSFYLPFTVDPDQVYPNLPAKGRPLILKYDLFFAGYSQDDSRTKPIFKEAYKKRVEILDYLKQEIGDRFCYITERKLNYEEYLAEMAEARIIVNVGIGCFNLRDFEAIAMGKPLITLAHPEYISVMANQRLFLFETKEEALESFNDIMVDNYVYSMMTQTNRKMFMKDHHPEYRINDIIEAINDAKQKN